MERFEELLALHVEGRATAEEAAELEGLLRESPDRRREFVDRNRLEVDLTALFQARLTTRRHRSVRRLARREGGAPKALFAAAAVLLAFTGLLVGVRPRDTRPAERPAAKPVEVEEADVAPAPERRARVARRARPVREVEPPAPEPTPEPEAPPPSPPPKAEAAPKVEPGPAASQAESAWIARVEGVVGEVFLVEGERRTRIDPGRPLRGGEGLDGEATIVYPDGTRVELKGGSEVRQITEAKGKRLFVARGRVRADVAKQPAPMVIATPQAEARVLGTRLEVSVSAQGTRVEVEEGRVRVTRRPDGASVELSAGHHAVASAGVPLAARPRERVVWRWDAEDGQRPAAFLEGKVAAGPPRAGNRFAFESSDYIAREYGPGINLQLSDALGSDPASYRLRFRYFAAGGTMTAQFYSPDGGDNFRVTISDLIAGRWSWVDVPLSYFARTGGARLKKGDRLSFLNMFVVVRGNAPVYWDDVELVEVLGR